MSDSDNEKMAREISEIHAVVLGVNGQGGLHRQVQQIEADVQQLKQWKARALGWVAGATAVAAATGAKLGAYLTGK